MKHTLPVIDWDLIAYDEALNRQQALVEQVATEKSPGVLVLCTHPPVVTLGRKTQPGDVVGWKGPVFEASRGGRATYHGPSQLIAYPILNFNSESAPFHRDINRYLRLLETALVQTLAEYNLSGTGSAHMDFEGREMTGVWVDGRKIASIGIGVRKWVSCHGLALNVDHDAQSFQGLKPCGFHSGIMTSMQELLGKTVERAQLKKKLVLNLQNALIGREQELLGHEL